MACEVVLIDYVDHLVQLADGRSFPILDMFDGRGLTARRSDDVVKLLFGGGPTLMSLTVADHDTRRLQ